MVKAEVVVNLKDGVLDPQGKAICNALHTLGYRGVKSVHVGRVIRLELEDGVSVDEITQMSEKLLANPIIEDYNIHI